MIYKNFLITDLNLTVYRIVSDGIMSKIKTFSSKWWNKRLQAHYFIFDIYKENEIEQLNNQQDELKKEILRNKDDYEKIIDDATNQIETFLEKANQKDSIQ